MKKAKEYMKEFWHPNTDDNTTIIDVIRQAQIDAIDATVKMCAEEANLLINNLSSTDKDYNDYYQCGDDEISVNRKGILQVADKLKKELE